MSNKIIRDTDSLDSSVASVRGRRAFPLRTLMVCFTTWLITTEILIFDQAKFNAKAELLDEAARALRGPQLIVPGERSLNPSGNAKMERL
jgi:hypothetical protein